MDPFTARIREANRYYEHRAYGDRMLEIDTVAATAVYTQAIEVAKAEYETLIPELNKLQKRAGNLKRLIQSASALVGIPVDARFAVEVSRR